MKFLGSCVLALVIGLVGLIMLGEYSGGGIDVYSQTPSGDDQTRCTTTLYLIKKYSLPGNPDVYRQDHETTCNVSGAGEPKTVTWAYTTPITRNNGRRGVPFTATVYNDNGRYGICTVQIADGPTEPMNSHRLCGKTSPTT